MVNSTEILNPWWQNPDAIEADSHIMAISGKPFYFDNPLKEECKLERGHSYILRGARQVGKTTFIKEMIRKAISSKVFNSSDCIYLTCEALSSFSELQNLLMDWLKEREDRASLVCLDEITFVDEWQRAILWLINAGLFKNTTALISGSNARDLKRSAERFPGRHVREMKIYPLSIKDYSSVQCLRGLQGEDLLATYLTVGGFPHAVRDYHEFGLITDDTYETYANWIFGDAHRFSLNREILLHILYRIYDTITSRVTYQRLIEKSPIKSHETAAAYIEHLEEAFLCRILSCYDLDKDMAAPRKAKKMYFIDPLIYQVVGGFLRGVRNTFEWWKNELKSKTNRGNIFESVVVNNMAKEVDRIYFWYSANSQREVDILTKKGKEIKLFEVKSKPEKIRPVLGKDVTVISASNFPFQTSDF